MFSSKCDFKISHSNCKLKFKCYFRALVRKSTTKEEEAVRFGIARAEKAIDNSVGHGAVQHFAHMELIIQRFVTVLNLAKTVDRLLLKFSKFQLKHSKNFI